MTEEQVQHIVRHWSTLQDTWQGDNRWGAEEPADSLNYPPPKEFLDKKSWRELPDQYGKQAREYIYMYTTRYPLQMRTVLGFPMWLRFCDVWHDTGDFARAMRAI